MVTVMASPTRDSQSRNDDQRQINTMNQHNEQAVYPMYEKPNHPVAFVFWGNQFDEMLAVLYLTQFRQAGVATQLIGLTGKLAWGQHGMPLATDSTLGDALPLAPNAACVIIPCHSPILGQIDTDPRVRIFLQRAAENDAQFITGRVDGTDLEIFPVAKHRVQVLVHESTLIDDVRRLSSYLALMNEAHPANSVPSP